jgi:hypothetical protein
MIADGRSLMIVLRVSRRLLQALIPLLVACSVLGGCAFGNRHVTLSYQTVTSSADGQGIRPLLVETFADERPPEQPEVGNVQNLMGMKTAKVLVADGQSIGRWVTDALIAELDAAGFDVRHADAVPEGFVGCRIGGSVEQVYIEMYMTYDATIKLNIQIVCGDSGSEDSEIMNRAMIGSWKETAVFASASEYERVLVATLQDVLQKSLPVIESRIRAAAGE